MKCMKVNFYNNKGITLMEVMVTVLIFSILLVGVYASALVTDKSFQTNKTQIEVQQEIRKAMEWMKYDLRQAGASSIVDVPANGTAYTSITFKRPNDVKSGSIEWEDNAIQFILGGTNSQQLLRVSGGVTNVLANNIQTLQFTRQTLTSNILEVSMIAQKQAIKGELINYQLDFEVQLRNQ